MLAFSFEDQREAEKEDQTELLELLEQVKQNEADILRELGIQKEQALDAIRGLQNVSFPSTSHCNWFSHIQLQALEDVMTDQLQKQFAELSLNLLKKIEPTKVVSYDWAISELEIQIDGAVIGAGGFGQVLIGSWRKAKVAVKRMQRETPKNVSHNSVFDSA